MLSNTATPKYYGAFRAKVLAGEIPVCREIAMEMNRIDELIADPNIYYDDRAVEGFVRFAEAEMTLTDGEELKLLDSFLLWAEQIFGGGTINSGPSTYPKKEGMEGILRCVRSNFALPISSTSSSDEVRPNPSTRPYSRLTFW